MKRAIYILLILAAIGICAAGYTKAKSARLILGDERSELYMPLLKGKRVALLSNQTGVIRQADGSRHP